MFASPAVTVLALGITLVLLAVVGFVNRATELRDQRRRRDWWERHHPLTSKEEE